MCLARSKISLRVISNKQGVFLLSLGAPVKGLRIGSVCIDLAVVSGSDGVTRQEREVGEYSHKVAGFHWKHLGRGELQNPS